MRGLYLCSFGIQMELKALREKVYEISEMNLRQVNKFSDSLAVSLVDNKAKGFLMQAVTLRLKALKLGEE